MTPDDRRPIGLLGGSFDPIHVGHVQLARDAMLQLDLARVLFVRAGLAWQKGPPAGAAHRASMIELANADAPRLALDRRGRVPPRPQCTGVKPTPLGQEGGRARPRR